METLKFFVKLIVVALAVVALMGLAVMFLIPKEMM